MLVKRSTLDNNGTQRAACWFFGEGYVEHRRAHARSRNEQVESSFDEGAGRWMERGKLPFSGSTRIFGWIVVRRSSHDAPRNRSTRLLQAAGGYE